MKTISLGRLLIQKFRGIKMFQGVEILLGCVINALLELYRMVILKTREDGLKNPYALGHGDFVINDGGGRMVFF